MATHQASFTDYGGEVSAVAVRVVEPTAVTFDAWVTAQGTLVSAIENVSIGQLRQWKQVIGESETDNTKASNVYAQRESKWLVRCIQDDGAYMTFEIPCANLALLVAGEDYMNVAAGAGLDLVTAIEANVYGRDGALVTFDKAFHVGRNI